MNTRQLILLGSAAAGATLLTSCGMAPEQAAAIGDIVAERLAESDKFDPEQSRIVGDAVAEALEGSGGWQGILSTVVNGAIALVLTYLGIGKAASAVRAVKQAKQTQA